MDQYTGYSLYVKLRVSSGRHRHSATDLWTCDTDSSKV